MREQSRREALRRALREAGHPMKADELSRVAIRHADPFTTRKELVEEAWRMVDEQQLRWTLGGEIDLIARDV